MAINYNSDLIEKIVILEKDYEDGLNKDDVKEKCVFELKCSMIGASNGFRKTTS